MDELNLSEEVVFDELVNEVSIEEDEQNRSQSNLIDTQSTSSSTVNDNQVNQFIEQTIKSPTVNTTGQVSSIRNVTPNAKSTAVIAKNQKTTISSPNKVVNNIVLTPKNQSKNKQQTTPSSTSKKTISIPNNQQILTKVIMTTGGQQLLITSPVKQTIQGRAGNESLSINQEKQQLIGLLPISSQAKQANKNDLNQVSIRPKSAGNLTIQSSNPPISEKQPQYQIIRLVSASNNATNTTNSTITAVKQGQLTPATQQQKVLIPASALKNFNASQLLMYTPTQTIIQQSASTATASKQVSFSTNIQQHSTNNVSTTNTTTAQRQSYVPILPNPSTVMNNSASGSSKTTLVQKSLQNGPKNSSSTVSTVAIASTSDELVNKHVVATASTTGSSSRPRKPCNCTRSQCLKLYCDCFANGEFCSNCNCINCFNNLDHEENRQKAIKQCLERNPHAFHPKIGKGKATAQESIERTHKKGCNCRRSGCLKNYCECYEAKILCTDLCKCCACKNYEDSYERKSLMHLVDTVDIRSSVRGTTGSNFTGKENDPLWSNEFRPKLPVPFSDRLLTCSFITNELVDATCQCLIAQAEKSQKLNFTSEEKERAIIEEFGNCLTQIINQAKVLKEI